jgi:hypothetical protein
MVGKPTALVARRSIPIVDFDGFDVMVYSGCSMPCIQMIFHLCIALGNYTVTDHFYVVELPNTNIILGVQWLISLGKHYVDY